MVRRSPRLRGRSGGAVQIAVQGRLGERVGSLEALTTAAVVGGLIALTALLLVRRSVGGVGEASLDQNGNYLVEPWACSSSSRSPLPGPRIGIVATTAFLIAAQFGLATAIDRYGWFGVERVALTWTRALGIGLLVVGAALTLRR